MIEALSLSFFQNALLAGALASIACGIIGSLVVVNRQVFLAGGVAHAAYGGVGLGIFLGLPVLPCAVIFTALAALVTSAVTFEQRQRTDSVVGVLWATGMALGILLVNMTPGYNVDLMSYLFGSILTVPTGDVWAMLVLDLLVVAFACRWYPELLSLSFDADFARARGIPVRRLHALMLVMIAVAVVMVIQVVGLILVIALLTIPPMLAERNATSLARMMVTSTIYCFCFCMAGLALAYEYNLASGAAIIAVASATFFIMRGASALRPGNGQE